MTTAQNITTEQIQALRDEANGDLAMVAICDIAMGYDDSDAATEHGADWTEATATAECARVIAAAEAMVD